MAKKIRFSLDMGNGIEVRTLEELKENFSIEKVLGYYADGKLVIWLKDRYLDDLAEELAKLEREDPEIVRKICDVFGVEYSQETDLEAAEDRNRKIALLKEYAVNSEWIDKVDDIAFDQDDFYNLLDEEKTEIYLCGQQFSIPLSKSGMKYVGVNHPVVIINSKEVIDFQKRNIEFVDVRFDDAYQSLLNSAEKVGEDSFLYSDLIDDFNNLRRDNLVSKLENEVNKSTALADKARYMLKSLNAYIPGEAKKINFDTKREIKQAAQNGYEAAKICCSLDYNESDYAKRCCETDAWENLDREDSFLLYEIGRAYLETGNQGKAAEYIEKAAEQNDWRAEYKMGVLYENGRGVERNLDTANRWYKKAAEKGYTKAYYDLGYNYLYLNEKKDIETAQIYIKAMFKDTDYAADWMANYRNSVERIPKIDYGKVRVNYISNGEIESKSRSYVINKLENEYWDYFARAKEVFDDSRNEQLDSFAESYIKEYEKLLKCWSIWMYGTGKIDCVFVKPGELPMDYKTDIRKMLGNLLRSFVVDFSAADIDPDYDYQWSNFSITREGLFGGRVTDTKYCARLNPNRFNNMIGSQLGKYSQKAHEVMREYFINTLL